MNMPLSLLFKCCTYIYDSNHHVKNSLSSQKYCFNDSYTGLSEMNVIFDIIYFIYYPVHALF